MSMRPFSVSIPSAVADFIAGVLAVRFMGLMLDGSDGRQWMWVAGEAAVIAVAAAWLWRAGT